MKNKFLNRKILNIFFILFFILIFFGAKSQLGIASCCCRAERPADQKLICKDVDNCDNGNNNPCFNWAQQQGYENIAYGHNEVCPDNCKDTAVNFKETSAPIVPKLSIPIPGLNLTSDSKLLRVCAECGEAVDDITKCPDDKCLKWTYKIPWIGEFINAFYKWAVSAIAIFAVLVIVNGAFSMVTAGGKAEKIKHAEESIWAGIIGVVIILIAHQVIYMVDPRLVVLKPIIIGSIKRVEFLPMESDVEQGVVNINPGEGFGVAVDGSCFPVSSNSLRNVSWNWGSRRSDGKRCHAGVDILTKGPGEVLALSDGRVIGNFFFYKCSGQNTNAIMINHGNFVALYGEINSNTAQLGVGTEVQAGQFLGSATYCGMLHLELYRAGTTVNYLWRPPNGQLVPATPNYCRTNYLSTKPERLLDPTETIKSLDSKRCK